MFKFTLFALLASASASPLIPRDDIPAEALPESSTAREPSFYRLPASITPLNYSIKLFINPENVGFSGETDITIRANTNTSSVVLHGNRINFDSFNIKNENGTSIDATLSLSGDDRHFVTLTLPNNTNLLSGGIYSLHFIYNTSFSSNLDGLYRGSYVFNSTRRYWAATQFQATHAREVFPCFDEPALKATFDISIYAPPQYHSLCNTDQVTSNLPPVDGFNVTTFRTTPRMSTYLIAFVVSDFDFKSNTRDGPLIYPREYRVYARRNARDTLDYSLDVGQRTFQYLQSYTDVPYRMNKLDNVAVPSFGAGAMENWGLITYQEPYMLYNENVTNSIYKMYIATIMSHENAHFWFGNEVSPLWWDYLWLNEGFATIFEFYATEKVFFGEWRLIQQFTTNEMQNVMIQDSLPGANPMSSTVGSPAEIDSNFNGIAYSKSGSVIKMMMYSFGEQIFRLGLSNYLKSLPTGVTEPEILFNALQGVMVGTNFLPANTTVSDIFGSWSNQAGYPIIYAIRDYTQNEIKISQERFFQNSNLTSNSSWWVPITWVTPENKDSVGDTLVQRWLRPYTNIYIPIESGQNWFYLNKQQTGYYRVMYDMRTWENLVNTLVYWNPENYTWIHPSNRAQLLDDSFMFARTGRLSYNISLSMLTYLRREVDWIPWVSANRAINYLNPKMPASEYYNNFRMLLSEISSKAFSELGINVPAEDSYVNKRMRTLISRIACDAGEVNCLLQAALALDRVISGNDTSKVHPDVQPVVYCYGLKTMNSSTSWNFLFGAYVDSVQESEKSIILNALGCPQNNITINSYLQMTITNGSQVRSQDREEVVRSVINAGPYGIKMALDFLTDNFVALSRNIFSNFGTYRIITNLGNVIIMDEDIQAFENFAEIYRDNFTANEISGISVARQTINTNQLWRNSYMEEIDSWLSEYSPSSAIINVNSFFMTTVFSAMILIRNVCL